MSDYILGSDEVGYGAWAGPLVVCAFAALKTWKGPFGLNDSKKLTPAERNAVYAELAHHPLVIISVENTVIDEMGVAKALIRAHTRALQLLLPQFPGADIVVDGIVRLPEIQNARYVPRADGIFPAVMAASIVAKVNHDYVMQQHHLTYPHYGFDTGVGYGTKKQEIGIDEYGVCPLHRRSYRPVREALLKAMRADEARRSST